MADGEVIIEVGVEDKEAKRKLEDVEDAAKDAQESVEDLGDGASKGSKGLGMLDVAAGNLVAGGISSLVSGLGEAVTSLLNLAEETREFRDDMAKLETAFTTSGFKAEDASKVYEDFYAILGESDRSVEAVNHLAELTDNTEDLSKWSTIAAGVTAKFGDSLPLEGLTEAANETAKVGQVTGVFADALNWASADSKVFKDALGGNKKAMAAFNKAVKEGENVEDAFSAALAKMASEQERSAAITNTLNGLYSDAAGEYNELTAETQAARRATAEMEQAQAKLGEEIEPLTTAWTQLKAKGLEAITPVVAWLSDSLLNMTNNLFNNKSAVDARLEASRNAVETVRAEAEAYKELQIAQFEQAAGDLAHLENAELLYNELLLLADANGKVDEANRSRAEFIVSTLSEATGIELEMVGNQIVGYGNLKTAVEEAIRAKQAEILLANDLTAYTEALENKTIKEQEQTDKLIELSEQRQNVQKAEDELAAASADYWDRVSKAKSESDYRQLASFATNVEIKKQNLKKEEDALSNLETAYQENEEILQNYYEDIASYQEAQSLIMQGKTEEAIKLLEKKNSKYLDSEKIVGDSIEAQKAQLEKQAIHAGVNAVLMRQRYEEGVEGVTEAMVKTAEEAAETAKTEFEKIGGQIGDGIGKGAEDKKPGLLTKIKNIVAAMKKAAEEEADINSPSKEFEWIAEMMMAGLEKGTVENGKGAVDASRKVVKDMLAEAQKQAETGVEAIEDKIDKLSEKRTSKNSKEIDAQKKVLQKEKELLQKRARELESYGRTVDKQLTEYTALFENYEKDVARVHENLAKDIENAEKSYATSFQNTYNSLRNSLNLFTEAEKGESVYKRDLPNALESQIEVLKDYNTALDTLSGRGINQEFVDELKGMGLDILPELKAINKMSDEELTEYVALWEEKNELARKATESVMQTQKEGMLAEIESLKDGAVIELAELETGLKESMITLTSEISLGMKEIGESGLTEIAGQLDEYVSAGENLMEGVAEGIKNGQSAVADAAEASIIAGIKAAKAAAGIHSPSTVTKKEVGANLALGVSEGWDEKLNSVKNSLASGMGELTQRVRDVVFAEKARFSSHTIPRDTSIADLAQAVGMQTAGISNMTSTYKGASSKRPIILQLDKRELGRAVVDVGGIESQRVGLSVTSGGYAK